MYIDKDVLEGYLNNKEKFGQLSKGRIFERFEEVKSAFQAIETTINVCEGGQKFPKAIWKDKVLNDVDNKDEIPRKIFAPSKIDLTAGERYKGIKFQQDYFQYLIDKKEWTKECGDAEFVKKILSIIGGFDSHGKMKDEYRILSNAQTSLDDFDSTLQSNGQYAWINSHFADNTLFCEFVDFVKNCKGDQGKEIKSEWYENIALCYPYAEKEGNDFVGKLSRCKSTDKTQVEKKEKETQGKIFKHRFPLKFLWMWANRNRVIHPLSLMAFREFLKSDFMKSVFDGKKSDLENLPYDVDENGVEMCLGEQVSSYAKKITNAKIEYFSKIWEKISDLIKQKFKCEMENVSLLISLLTLSETNMTNIDELLKTHKQIILYGVPGTGKTHSAKELIREWGEIAKRQEIKQKNNAGQQPKEKPQQVNTKEEDILKECHFNKVLTKDNKQAITPKGEEYAVNSPIVWEIMQFHPNTTYQDFIGGIIPKTEDKSLTYEAESGKFKKFCEYASANPKIPFVFIIDEINRANLSEVLGELLYALEYRDEKITIPNFDEPFVIPSNVYIIGTMNNVDKSLSTFDLALRRRFGFYEVGIDCEVIEKMLDCKVEKDYLEKYIERCQDLNALISDDFDEEDRERLGKEKANALGLEKHYKIGQAYFAKIEKFFESNEGSKVSKITPIHLTKLWDYHLQPLIEEYIGFSMGNQEISNKLDNLKAFWIRELK